MALDDTPRGAAGLPEQADVLVVGGGPAGAVAALAAKRHDPAAHVVLVDRHDFPRDKACGDGIAPFVLHELAGLGLDPADVVAGSAPVHGIRLRGPRGTTATGVCPEPDHVVPRTIFDARLVRAATEAGVELRRHTVRSIDAKPHGVRIDGCLATVVVAADGANSLLRRATGQPGNPQRALAIAVRGYAPTPPGWTESLRIDMQEIAWPSYAWHFPIGNGMSNVGFGMLRASMPAGEPRMLHRRLAELLPEAPADPGTLRAHHLPLSTHRPRQPDGRVLLAGDAASLINPLTGEGIFYAVHSGRLAGEAAAGMISGRLPDAGRAYRRALRASLGLHLLETSGVAWLANRPPLVEAAVRAGGSSPALFASMIEMGLGRGNVPPLLLARVFKDALGRRLRPKRLPSSPK